MGFSIKKSNLKWIVLGIVAVIAISFGVVSAIQKKINEKRQQKELEEYIEKTIEREYKDLVRQYESYKETMEDYDYSYDMRSRYRRKINDLVGTYILNSNSVSSEDDKRIKELLHLIAKKNAYEKLLEE